jgi:hypothetical protein
MMSQMRRKLSLNTRANSIQVSHRPRESQKLCRWLLAGLALGSFANLAAAGTITFGGQITQSSQDGTGPAENNPSLNNIADLQDYNVILGFLGSINAPGTYNLTSLTFSVPAAGVTETSFGTMSLTITLNGAFDDLSLLGCLTTGSGCFGGNQLDANFEIPAAALNGQNIVATGLDLPHPVDLLEDDGVTDIQGAITTYSNTSPANAVPEPSSFGLLACLLAGWIAFRLKRLQLTPGLVTLVCLRCRLRPHP